MPVQPTLQLTCRMTLLGEHAWWSEDDGSGDPYIGTAYQWHIRLEIDGQYHSNHATYIPNYYGGDEVQVGDWFASGAGGKALRIVEILSQNTNEVICIAEDYERYNLFSDNLQTGSGMCPEGAGIIFRLSEDGLPILGPVPEAYLQPNTITDLTARFMARNMVSTFVLVKQQGHGMSLGDLIYADFEDNDGYNKVDAANISRAIGIVTEVNVPGLDYFCYRPLGKLLNNVQPPLIGGHGDVFYADPANPGKLTNVKPSNNALAVYLRLDLPNRAILLERGIEGSTAGDNTANETHKYDVEEVTNNQTEFTLPADAQEVMYMSINGIENENYTFDINTKVLVFDPVATGYGVDSSDEVFFIYKS